MKATSPSLVKRKELLKTLRRSNQKNHKAAKVKPLLLMTKPISPERQQVIAAYKNRDVRQKLVDRIGMVSYD